MGRVGASAPHRSQGRGAWALRSCEEAPGPACPRLPGTPTWPCCWDHSPSLLSSNPRPGLHEPWSVPLAASRSAVLEDASRDSPDVEGRRCCSERAWTARTARTARGQRWCPGLREGRPWLYLGLRPPGHAAPPWVPPLWSCLKLGSEMSEQLRALPVGLPPIVSEGRGLPAAWGTGLTPPLLHTPRCPCPAPCWGGPGK